MSDEVNRQRLGNEEFVSILDQEDRTPPFRWKGGRVYGESANCTYVEIWFTDAKDYACKARIRVPHNKISTNTTKTDHA